MAKDAMFPIDARNLAVRFGTFAAISGIDLSIHGTRRIAVLGANGAGKSVLLRTLHGLLAPTDGTISWCGSRVRPPDQAMVFQRPVMLRRSALANIEYALDVQGVRGGECETRARGALQSVGLGAIGDRQARVLSSGEQQRLALARAWALRPRILFLDEPTSSLDPSAAAEVERIMEEIHREGTALVMSTHVLGLAHRMADEIVFLHQGRILERTPADHFFSKPQTPEAERFLKGELPWNGASPRS